MLGEMVAKRQTESQQHPRKFTRAAAWEGREPCSWSQEASGGSCWSLVPAGQSERVRTPPLLLTCLQDSNHLASTEKEGGTRLGKVYLLNRVQLRHCVPKARRQPKHLCSPCRSTATDVALLALRSSRPSS